ncbi:META domain-containing protein [Spirosoma sp. KNUC1025]|uniref:META domain-containing protein n=1 Tax=Spirosoma sp. KNUC1025 TaxID=2894082 RepID=UPI00386D6494|nr:META domain-containing protein [Spirosoma sp. KNUC1025]
MRTLLFGLLILVTACRRPSTQFAAMLSPIGQPADYTRYLKSGDELVAVGSDPSWSFTVNSSKGQMTFKSANGDSLTTTVPERQTDSDGVFRYNAQVESGSLNVVFRPDSCIDSKTGQRYDYRVQLDVRGKNYIGCGISLQKLALLQDIWVLTDFQGRSISASGTGREVPRLEISLTEGRVTGTTGCNRLSGNVKADTRLIQFGPMVMTKMACADPVGTFENTFLNALVQPVSYQIAEGKLTLLRNGQQLMVFKKVD